MRAKLILIACALCLLIAGCASVDTGRSATATQGGSAEALRVAVQNYQKLEPRLTAQQKTQFKENYAAISKSYQTAGVLLESVTDAVDPASAYTALISYETTVAGISANIDKLGRLVRSFGQ